MGAMGAMVRRCLSMPVRWSELAWTVRRRPFKRAASCNFLIPFVETVANEQTAAVLQIESPAGVSPAGARALASHLKAQGRSLQLFCC